MLSAIRSELRKLLTVRSTYFIVAAGLLLTAFVAGFVQGVKASPEALKNPQYLAAQSYGAIGFVGLIIAFASLLLIGHEYRYNTIMYTLTSTNSRAKVLFAKIAVVTLFAVVSSLLIALFSPLCTIVGAHLVHHQLGAQMFPVVAILWRCLFAGWAYAMYAFLLAVILRNQVGAVVTFLLVPLVGENILMLLLKENTKYLPFRAVQQVAQQAEASGPAVLSAGHAAVTALLYIAIGTAIAAALFVRRDAN